MDKKYRYLIYDILMAAGIVLLVIASLEIYFNYDWQSPETKDREVVYYSTSELDLESPELVEEKQEVVNIEIPRGASILEIAEIMEEKELMDAHNFLWYINEFDLDTRIRAGDYQFSSEVANREILDQILLPEQGGENND